MIRTAVKHVDVLRSRTISEGAGTLIWTANLVPRLWRIDRCTVQSAQNITLLVPFEGRVDLPSRRPFARRVSSGASRRFWNPSRQSYLSQPSVQSLSRADVMLRVQSVISSHMKFPDLWERIEGALSESVRYFCLFP